MKIRKYTILLYILAVAMILPLSSMAASSSDGYEAPGYAAPYIEGADGPSALSISLEHVIGESLNIVVEDSRTGKVWESNPVFKSGDKAACTEAKKRELRSQLMLTYVYDKNGNAGNLADIGYMSSATTQGEFNSYEESVVKNQIAIYMILDNDERVDYYAEDGETVNPVPAGRTVKGFRIVYGMGDRNSSLYPVMLTAARMEERLAGLQILDDDGNFDEAATEKMKKTILSKYRLVSYEDKLNEIERQVKRQKTDSDKAKKRKEMEEALETYVTDYPIVLEQDIYELYTDAVSTQRYKKQLIGYWATLKYTREDMDADHEEVGYASTASGLGIDIPVDYVIEGNTLRASIVTSEINYPPEIGLLRLDLLPAFGGADDTVQEGYTFVPDGSGALVPLNPVDLRQTGYQVAVMNRQKDEALARDNMNFTDIPYYEQTILPVFGQKQDDNAFFCIIEEGYEFANVVAYTADNFTKFNTTFCSFFPTITDQIFYASGSDSGIAMFPKIEIAETKEVTEKIRDEVTGQLVVQKVVKDVVNDYARLPKTNMTVRYCFLSGDKANYSGMAEYFRNYLMNTYNLSKRTASENITYYADLYGIIDKKVSYAGFPFNVKYPLTTFDDARTIVDSLFNNGVKDLKLRYMYVANGGAKATYANEFDPERKLGNDKGLKSLISDMAARGVEVYPDIDLLHVYQDKLFDGFNYNDDAIMTLGKTESVVMDLNIATGRKEQIGEMAYFHPRWMVSPIRFDDVFASVKNDLDEYNNPHVSLGTVGYTVFSDFNEDLIIDRGETARALAAKLKELEDAGYDIIVEKGFYNTLPYVSTVLNIPMTSSQFSVELYDVPFAQMVLHGLVDYAGEPINVSQNVQYNILKCLEYGASVYGRFMYEDDSVFQNTYYMDLYSLHYESWMDETNTIYTTVNEILKDVQDQFIVNHECLAKNVYRTTYENGLQITVNYNTVDYVDEATGVTIGARDFKVGGDK